MIHIVSQSASVSALTLRGIPEPVDAAIRARAKRDRISLNKAVISLLEEAVEKSPDALAGPPYHDLDEFFGTWSAEEADQFDASLREQRKIDKADWV